MGRTRSRAPESGAPTRVDLRRLRLASWICRITVIALAAAGVIFHATFTAGEEAHAAPVEAPEVMKMLTYNDRMDEAIDELRGSLVLKVPRGYVNPETGALQQVDGKYLRLGFDFRGDNSNDKNPVRALQYLNSFGEAGATRWAKSQSESYTVHQVVQAGDNDYLVISIEGNMSVEVVPGNNVPGGRQIHGSLYFSFEKSNTASTGATGWMRDALLKHPVSFNIYAATRNSKNVAGPVIQIQYNSNYGLWSYGQANLGQVLDYGLNKNPPGVMPANSIPVDMVNMAYSNTRSGPANSLSTSFWYAWVHEDGTLVTTVNTAPIRVTGIAPHSGAVGTLPQIVKNMTYPSGRASLAYTPEAAAQGLTQKVDPHGEIDFRDAEGSGYYRLLVWPETSDPEVVTSDSGAPKLQYTSEDLVDGTTVRPEALQAGWTAGSVFYNYTVPRPQAPVIDVPVDGSKTNENARLRISGRGVPGHSISLKLQRGAGPISNPDSSTLISVVDGERDCAKEPCAVIVRPDGTWSYTYTPDTPLADGHYALVARQTNQSRPRLPTSDPSNPNRPQKPNGWGVSFEVTTVPPTAPIFPCPASPTDNARPALSGSGVAAGARVRIYLGDKVIGEAKVSGKDWSYTPEQDLPPGLNTLTVTQTDSAGNESARSAPPCSLTVSVNIPIQGKKTVVEVAFPASGLGTATPDNWEVFVADSTKTQVISGKAEVSLERGVTYKLDERLRSDPEPDATALLYAPLDTPECVDATGSALSAKNFNRAKSELRFEAEDDVAAPINCTIRNQSHQATIVTKRLGGQTTEVSNGWQLRGEPKLGIGRSAPASTGGADSRGRAAAGVGFQLSASGPDAVVRPGDYDLESDVPAGFAAVGVDRLDLEDRSCAAFAQDPTAAPERCWDTTHAVSARLDQGAHEVFRVVAAEANDMPALPLTGGLGSWIFTVGGSGAILAAAAGLIRRRCLAARGVSGPQTQLTLTT